jgi:retron-type reverse transcriptase
VRIGNRICRHFVRDFWPCFRYIFLEACATFLLRRFALILANASALGRSIYLGEITKSGTTYWKISYWKLLILYDIILEAMDQKSVTALILLDLSKAFDSVHHQTLLNKLRHIGASLEEVKWFESYLTGRSQFVRIGTSVSSSLDITHGVPQGAILSPLLFSIY